jgi:hypothetical protein
VIAIESCGVPSKSSYASEALWAAGRETSEVECNSGGPMSRQRRLDLHATILGEGIDFISCPMVRFVALEFGTEDPVTYVHQLSEQLGYPSPEAARVAIAHFSEPLYCSGASWAKAIRVADARPEKVLEEALILGLSNTSLFDPKRPVIWTRSRLTRPISLYDIRSFYA